MKRDDNVYLHHILDAIALIEEYTNGMSENRLLANSMAHDAVVRQIEIIGEAARNISDEFQANHPQVPWGKMTGFAIRSSTNISISTLQLCRIP